MNEELKIGSNVGALEGGPGSRIVKGPAGRDVLVNAQGDIMRYLDNQPGPGIAGTIAASGTRRYTPATSGTYMTEAQNFYSAQDRTPPTADEEAKIRAAEYERVQKMVDFINQSAASKLAVEKVAGEERLGRARAIASRSGLLGSDIYEIGQKEKVKGYNKQQESLIEEERVLKIAEIMGRADTRAGDRIKAEQELAGKNQEAYLSFLGNVATQARSDVANLAKAGVSLNELTDEEYTKLLDQSGYQPLVFNAVYNANLPSPQKREYHYEKVGNQIAAFSVNPATKKLERETFDTEIPGGFTDFTVTADGTPLFINKNTGKAQVAAGFGEGQFAKPENPADVEYKRLRNEKLRKELSGTENEEVISYLQAAQEAIEGGASPDAARRRFLDKFPTKGDLFLKYTKQAY